MIITYIKLSYAYEREEFSKLVSYVQWVHLIVHTRARYLIWKYASGEICTAESLDPVNQWHDPSSLTLMYSRPHSNPRKKRTYVPFRKWSQFNPRTTSVGESTSRRLNCILLPGSRPILPLFLSRSNHRPKSCKSLVESLCISLSESQLV